MLIASALALASIAAGCGGSSEASAPPIGKAAFIKKANAVCEATQKSVLSEGIPVLRKIEHSTGKTGREAEAVYIPQWLVPATESEIEELRALGAPSGDEDRVDAILEALQEVADLAKSDPKKYLYLQANFKHPYKTVEKLATEYGIEPCGQP